jgi:hypothetical protein
MKKITLFLSAMLISMMSFAGEFITCAEAVEICKETGETSTTESYTIRGYVTKIKTAYSTQYDNISFWMADAVDGGEVLQCYRVKPTNAGEENVKVGDFVEVTGTLVNYYNNTPEVNAGGKYTILETGEDVEVVLPEGLNGEGTEENPFTVEDVITLDNAFAGPYYVKGYIIGHVIGGDLKAGLDTEAPFEAASNATQGTNIIISAVAGDTTVIVPVALPKGAVRDANNLVEHPELLGKQVLIQGQLTAYFKVAGIKETTSIVVVENVESSVEDVVATETVTKFMKNGQIYIIKGGKTYNALGAEVK